MNQEETNDRGCLFEMLLVMKASIKHAGPMRTILGKAYVAALTKTVDDVSNELFDDRRPKIVHKQDIPPRFSNVYCSQCGSDFGPGDSGFSDCESHAGVYAP